MDQESKFDGIFMTVIQQKGNINGFFDSVFGFLRRKTDFFANQKQAEEIIVNSCKANFDKFTTENEKRTKEEQKRKEQDERKKKLRQEKQRLEAEAKKKAAQSKSEPVKQQVKQNSETAPGDEKKQDDGPAPLGNGGRTDKYIWTQTLQNLQMYIFLEPEVNKKLMKVSIGVDKLQVIVKGETVIDGKWKNKINAEETYWTIEDGDVQDYKGKYLHINVEKWKNQTSWWSTPIEGHAEINTQKINPEPSKLSDLEGETRSTVEKMMFDMNQKKKGLPTSDELEKQNKMQEFMKAHPEMDFSQCKFG